MLEHFDSTKNIGGEMLKEKGFFFIRILYIIIFIISGSADNANAEIINAKSCSQIDIQFAIDNANEGDIIQVPAGNCIWTSIGLGKPAVDVHQKGITIMGEGMDQTIINCWRV